MRRIRNEGGVQITRRLRWVKMVEVREWEWEWECESRNEGSFNRGYPEVVGR
jgi:hypothetical protein